MTALASTLQTFRNMAQSEREKGNYFERLVKVYLLHEPLYADLYGGKVWLWGDWRKEWCKRGNADPGADAGIDLVAETTTGELHAIQAKFYADDARLRLDDFATFFTASGKKHFARRLIVLTATDSTHHVREAVKDQHPPVNLISLFDLENSKIDWASFKPQTEAVKLKTKKTPLPHQLQALSAVTAGLAKADRGKMIMACGTGKTYAALKLAEKLAGKGGRVLFLVPSLNLLSQSLTEWTQESEIPLHCYAVCSDSEVGKKRKSDDDDFQMLAHELQYPATTEAKHLAQEMQKRHDKMHLSVVFSTYHSIEVISKAQQKHELDDFDLIICDEAHRTTGATFGDEDESTFVKVHDAKFIRADKRLYMTATPRIYGELAKAAAEKEDVALCSMDDEKLYGKQLHVLTFSDAVKRGLLSDYKVIVLAVEESHVNRRLQNLWKDENQQLKVDDAAKIIGCWKALSKQDLTHDLAGDDQPMKRAVAFCQVIEINKGGKTHKVSSKQIAGMFKAVVDAYRETEEEDEFTPTLTLQCEAAHVDGGMNAIEKESKLTWLKAEPPENTCRILSNVRCLSEGVDVPALDAVLFLTPRNSQVDVVQSVGRVMRNAPHKKRGYVILPVVIPAGVEPHVALSDNKTYKVVWQVLQALRSHDDRFDALVNKLDLIGRDVSKMEVIAITDKLAPKNPKAKGKNKDTGTGGFTIGQPTKRYGKEDQSELPFEIGEIERAIYAKLVQKVGNRHHWEDWANDIAKIARTHIDRIKGILETPANRKERTAFDAFAKELRDDLNDSITDAEIIEMLAQHLITKPVFDALFEGYSFAQHNPMSLAMQSVLDVLQEHQLSKETDTLQAFYDSVKMRAEGIENAAGKQKIVVELYDKFFRNAFPKMAERLGIVYTPVEVVDFIIQSIGHILKTEFGQTLGSKGVHIIDPFTGTGTFITRLLQSGLIKPEELPYKYQQEIHANEIVLLAYYIAAINIEATYHGIVGGDYLPFEGICLTDTFQLYEKEDLVDAAQDKNSARRKRQKKLDIRVIIGNPPYSIGQGSQNDNNQNVEYPSLDRRISDTYATRSSATNSKGLYDSYIRAIRWASDRVGNSGVIGFVTNAGFLEANTADGLRHCLAEEFSSIYVFHLRGNARTAGELRRKEKDNVFGMGSRAPIAISILVKTPKAMQHGQIFFHDIGDYLSREDKLAKIATYSSVAGITQAGGWHAVVPDEHGDWLNQRDDSFSEFIVLGDKKSDAPKLFENYSQGVVTSRDAWSYNFNQTSLKKNIARAIDFFNAEVNRMNAVYSDLDRSAREERLVGFLDTDATKFSWSRSLKQDLVRGKPLTLDDQGFVVSLYRPFSKQHLYFNRRLCEYVGMMPRMFPSNGRGNRVICVTGMGAKDFSTLIVDSVADFQTTFNGQCFPLYLYEVATQGQSELQAGLFEGEATQSAKLAQQDAMTDEGVTHFLTAYPDEKISKEDLFYYVYGLLHSAEYRERYADNLGKELPRIPRVKDAADFWAFSKAGRRLADLHIGYETVTPYPLKIETNGKLAAADYRVEKMRYGKSDKNGKDKDLTTLHYNGKITLTGIPLETYEYVVNGKPALDWVVERQCVKTEKDSGIVNDANDWAIETMKNPKYPLELVQRVVTVSLETMKIVKALPKLGELS
jgi:predicted helicase